MTQFNAPVRRAGGEIDVYTSLVCIAFLVLAAGVFLLAKRNIDHSKDGTKDGGVLTLVQR